MGSYGTHREKGMTTLQFFRQMEGYGERLIDGAVVDSVFYGAYRSAATEKIVGIVFPFSWHSGYENFVYKPQDEGMGPAKPS